MARTVAALEALAVEATGCTRCPLFAHATQTVFGRGPARAPLFLVGEQPGDKEDLAGLPFVGPAGRVLDDALDEAGIRREDVYVTNAVKHFKWTPRGKRRIHQKPNRTEIVACHIWLEQEIDLVDPRVVVALGATAGQSLWGPSFRLGAARGTELALGRRIGLATIHPSAVLRTEPATREQARRGLVADLRCARDLAAA